MSLLAGNRLAVAVKCAAEPPDPFPTPPCPDAKRISRAFKKARLILCRGDLEIVLRGRFSYDSRHILLQQKNRFPSLATGSSLFTDSRSCPVAVRSFPVWIVEINVSDQRRFRAEDRLVLIPAAACAAPVRVRLDGSLIQHGSRDLSPAIPAVVMQDAHMSGA